MNVLGIILTNYINQRLMHRYSSHQLFLLGGWLLASISIFVLLNTQLGWGGFPTLVVLAILYMSMNGLIVANSVVGAMSVFPNWSGAVSALTVAMQYGSGIFTSAILGWFSDGTPVMMGILMGGCGLLCLLCTLLYSRGKVLVI